jgi:amidase
MNAYIERLKTMTVHAPTVQQLQLIGRRLGFTLNEADVASFLGLMGGLIDAYNVVDAMPDNLPVVRYPRSPGHRPPPSDNPHNAWYVKSAIRGAVGGPLAGRTVAIKDNVCVAGVPMMAGASTLEGYVPDVDATIVQRILDAGATVLGKVHCEYFCLSGGSHTGAAGIVHNPWRYGWSAGGSSSGSAVVIATGEADMAIGGDQGGSIRIPASLCGVVGLKPTYGLVPYTGVMPIELTLDHVGPMTATVVDNAQMLEIIAGADGLDPRQNAPTTARYTEVLGRGVDNLKIGVVREAFEMPGHDTGVSAKVRSAADQFARLGALVEETSLPLHPLGKAIWTPIGIEGLTTLMMLGNAGGTNYQGLFVTSLVEAHSAWRKRADELADTLKLCMLAGSYMAEVYGGRYYGKASNIRRLVRQQHDELLQQFDLLLMPTTPIKATLSPPLGAPREEVIQHAFSFNSNCIPTNLSGHPAISIPCGLDEGLPVGLMLIGRHWDETTIYRAADAFERAADWRTL